MVLKLIFWGFLALFNYMDIKTLKMPDKFNMVGLVAIVWGHLFFSSMPLLDSFLGALVLFFGHLLVSFTPYFDFGGGDIKTAFVIGWFFNPVMAFYVLCYGLGFVHLIKWITKIKVLPYAPVLTLSIIVVFFQFGVL